MGCVLPDERHQLEDAARRSAEGHAAEAVETLRKAFADVAKDPEFIEDYKKVTGEEPDIVGPAEIEPLFARHGAISIRRSSRS